MIPSERSHIHVSASTHPGMSGKNNEDNYAVSAHHLSEEDPTPSLLAVLADGVGGHLAGEVAAEIATETISRLVSESNGSNPQKILKDSLVIANQKVAQQSSDDDGQLGMGSTCVCVWIIDDQVYTASLGDSRIYFIREGKIQQVTTDHTWVQEALEHGIITPEQAKNHPRAHVIRKYLGSKKPVEPDFRLRLNADETDEQARLNQGMKIRTGDQFLLCSDGLTDLVEDHEILEALNTRDKDQAIQDLIDLANTRGGHDNITIISLSVPQEIRNNAKQKEPRKGGKLSWQLTLAISILILVVVALGTVLYLYVSRIPAKATITPTPTLVIEIAPTEDFTPTQEIQTETLTPSPLPTVTSILETYTPWPTNTLTPEP